MMSSEPAAAQPRNPELPIVSAVIPAYNAADTIERALNSVYAQTYENIIEVIVVDDGSTDNTAQIVRDKFPDVILIQQENAGSPTARNRGVETASGDYIAFLDDDDEWFPEKTEVQMACFRKYPGFRMTIADSLPSSEGHAAPRLLESSRVTVRPLAFGAIFPSVPFHYGCSGWVFHRTLFDECGGFALHMRRSQDTEWLWRLVFRGYSAAFVEGPLFRYFAGTHRRTPLERAEMWRKWHRVLPPVVEHFARIAAVDMPLFDGGEANARLSAFYWRATWGLWNHGLHDEAVQCLTRGLECSGGRTSLRMRIAAWNPALYHALSRMRRRSAGSSQ